MQSVTIYTKPEDEPCIQCDMTRNWLNKNQVEFVEKNIYSDELDLEAMRALGLAAAPVVIVSQGQPKDDIFWGGFQPMKLKEHITTNTK